MTEHRSYLHKEASETSLRCTCGTWTGKHPTDTEGHAEHVLVSRPAFKAMTHVLARAMVTGGLVFTRVAGERLARVDDENTAAVDLLTELLAAVEPHLAAEHYNTAADRLDEVQVRNGERAWPFAALLRDDANRMRQEAGNGH